ncbi:hypothetical protein XW60_16540 [Mycobacteroides abscessus subsp. bolletii]|nr:hypothetical protein BST18_07090 [Mycobacteroides abscessus subsp. bolletii]TPF67264.1 hypothetical protein XW60_16540 [Mycobacteroides abscessus subsp. bolletii]
MLFTVVKELCEEDYDRYRSAYRTLDGILVENLFTYYEEAFKSLVGMWKDVTAGFATKPMKIDASDEMVFLGVRFRGAVLSLVSMLCYHQERTYDEISAKFGKTGDEYQAARDVFGALYDDYFGYRYLCRLRNVMIHDTIRAVSISVEAYANRGNPFAYVDLTMDRASLIKSDKINAALKAELSSKPGDPSIIQMAMEIHRALRDANRNLLTILHPDLTDVCNTIIEFDKLFEGKGGVRGLIHQMSPELRAPYTTGFTPWAGDVVMFARTYATEDWLNPDRVDD